MTELYEEFGNRLQGLIANKIKELGRNLTQGEIARKIGCKQSFISQMLKGKKLPSTDLAIRMRTYFNCSIDWLLCGYEKEYMNQDFIEGKVVRLELPKPEAFDALFGETEKQIIYASTLALRRFRESKETYNEYQKMMILKKIYATIDPSLTLEDIKKIIESFINS